jgi:hypothetical protein
VHSPRWQKLLERKIYNSRIITGAKKFFLDEGQFCVIFAEDIRCAPERQDSYQTTGQEVYVE